MFGDEAGLGMPQEDMTSLSAISALPTRPPPLFPLRLSFALFRATSWGCDRSAPAIGSACQLDKVRVPAEQSFTQKVARGIYDFWRAALGLLILLIVVAFPQGLVGGLKLLAARLGVMGKPA